MLSKSLSVLASFLRVLSSFLCKIFIGQFFERARLINAILKHGTVYVDVGQEYYEQRYRSRAVQNLKRKAQELGFELVATKEINELA